MFIFKLVTGRGVELPGLALNVNEDSAPKLLIHGKQVLESF